MSRRLRWLTLVAVVPLFLTSRPAEARCQFVSVPTTVSLGSYSVFGTTVLAAEVPVRIQCNPFSSGTLTLSASATNGSFDPRAMTNGADQLRYHVFRDAGGSQIWGAGQNASVSVNSTPQDKNFDIIMYFRVGIGQDVADGPYTDTLTLTLDPVRGGETPTRTFTVTATVLRECQVDAFALGFGRYDPVGAHASSALDGELTVNVRCTKGVQGRTSLSMGSNPAGFVRQMASGTHRLPYNIFIDTARSTIWNTSNVVTATSSSRLAPLGGGLKGYGRIPAGQVVAPGNYVDTVVATVTY